MFSKSLIFSLFLFSSTTLFSQYQNIKVSKSGKPEEVTISINPTNPLNLAAGANIDYYYYSMDGGLTWTEGHLASTLGVYGDPCMIFDPDGNLYYSHLSIPSSESWLDRIVVQKSINGGMTWNDGVGIGLNPPKQQDKEWLVADFTNSAYHNNLYVAWTEFDAYGSSDPNDSTRILFSSSTDSGSNWSQPARISDRGGDCLDGDSTVEGAVPAVGPNGEVYVSWAGPLGIMFDKSTDGGVTFGQDIFVTSQPGGWAFNVSGISRCNGLPVTACDISNSAHRGNIYILWSDQRNGVNDTEIFLIKSTDGGQTWGNTTRVNNDTSSRQQFFPWIAIDPMTGFIYVIFYDRRETAGDTTDVYVAKSTDGGDSFINFKVSESSFVPNSTVFFGDYTNIAARNGKIFPIWMRLDVSELSVWIAIINDSTIVNVEEDKGIVDDFLLMQNYPNPFNPTTNIEFSIPKSEFVTLKVYNILGEEVATLVSKELSVRKYKYDWDASNLASGIYLYRIQAGNFVETKKMVLLR
jgi:hypothetical protein